MLTVQSVIWGGKENIKEAKKQKYLLESLLRKLPPRCLLKQLLGTQWEWIGPTPSLKTHTYISQITYTQECSSNVGEKCQPSLLTSIKRAD